MQVPKPTGPAVEAVKRHAEHAGHEAKPWVERLARLGYGAKGVVYIVVGWLALMAALGLGGRKTGANGALLTIAQQPLGKVLLSVVALGLAGYALWRIVQGVVDPEHKGTDAKGLAKRFAYVLSGIAYVGLALTAVEILRVAGRADSGGSTQDVTARLMALPFGRWLVAAAGAVIIGIGLNTLYVAWTEKFREKLKWAQMNPQEQTWALRIGKLGLTARAVVFGVIGAFLIQAGLQADPGEARGLDGALKVLAQQSHGRWILGAVAAGLVAFGVYSFVEARYRRVMGS